MNLARLTETLVKHEGFKQFPYHDTVGKLTIGIGRNLEDVGISQSEARILLSQDIQAAVEGARKKFWWFDSLDDVRQEVIINMIFNLGLTGFGEFKKTIGYIQEGKFDQAAAEMLNSVWADQVGGRAQELAQMMASGVAV